MDAYRESHTRGSMGSFVDELPGTSRTTTGAFRRSEAQYKSYSLYESINYNDSGLQIKSTTIPEEFVGKAYQLMLNASFHEGIICLGL